MNLVNRSCSAACGLAFAEPRAATGSAANAKPEAAGAARRSRRCLGIAAILGFVLAGCSQPTANSQPNSNETAAVAVKTVHPKKTTVERSIKRPGFNIEPYQSTPIYARIGGYVERWNADIGDRVKKGAVLAELSVPEMAVEVHLKTAAVAQAEAEIRQAKSALARAHADEQRHKSQYERLAKVGQSGVIDRENVDETRFGYEAAKASVAKAEADVGVAEAKLQVAQRAREYVETLVRFAKLAAPFDGVVTRRNVSVGDLIQAGTKKGDALFVVDQVDPVRVFVNVPELEAISIHDGAAAKVRCQSLPGQTFEGKVTRTSRSLDPATRTLRTEIDLPNPKGTLLPGMYVDVTIVAEERKDTWALPATAIGGAGDDSFCFRVEDGKAIRTPLRAGVRGDQLTEVLKKKAASAKDEWVDFTGSEEIIADGIGSLKDGQKVTAAKAATK
jgi:HlyD family secretion protein